jgi:hypothetical protein
MKVFSFPHQPAGLKTSKESEGKSVLMVRSKKRDLIQVQEMARHMSVSRRGMQWSLIDCMWIFKCTHVFCEFMHPWQPGTLMSKISRTVRGGKEVARNVRKGCRTLDEEDASTEMKQFNQL